MLEQSNLREELVDIQMVEEFRIMKCNQLREYCEVFCACEEQVDEVVEYQWVWLTLHHWRVVFEEEEMKKPVDEGTEAEISQRCKKSHRSSDHHKIANT